MSQTQFTRLSDVDAYYVLAGCWHLPCRLLSGELAAPGTLPPSFHGSPNQEKSDYRVQTEFGVDFWTLLLQAGFDAVTIHSLIFPAGLAVTARRVT